MKNLNSTELMQLHRRFGMYRGVQLGRTNFLFLFRTKKIYLFSVLHRDEELLLAAVDWGQKLTLYQATGAKQVESIENRLVFQVDFV